MCKVIQALKARDDDRNRYFNDIELVTVHSRVQRSTKILTILFRGLIPGIHMLRFQHKDHRSGSIKFRRLSKGMKRTSIPESGWSSPERTPRPVPAGR